MANANIFPPCKDSLLTKKVAAKRLAVSVRTLDRMIANSLLEEIFVGSSPFRKKEGNSSLNGWKFLYKYNKGPVTNSLWSVLIGIE